MLDFDAAAYKRMLALSRDIKDIEAVPLPLVRDDQNYIFISYSHRDYREVYCDLADMYEAGVRFWYDRGLTPGIDWDAMVTEKIQDPRCSGVIFYLSKNLFLSPAIKREISIVTGRDEITGQEISGAKAYFSVNLTQGVPSDIVFSITPEEKREKKLDSRWLKLLMDTFTDESTYLSFSDANHASSLVEAICETFNVVKDPDVVVLAEGDYAGQTQNGCRHGYGTFIYTTGHVYEGDWEDDLRCGNGTLTRNGQVVYTGQWERDRYHGYGTYHYTDGAVYTGQWVNGLRCGQGRQNYADGAVYEGQWENGQRHGQGTYVYGDAGEKKRTYTGQWVHDRIEGVGLFTTASGDTYEGEFVENKFCGYGVYSYQSGALHAGYWANNKENGQGTYTYKDGKSWTGEFKDGKKWDGQGFVYYYNNGKSTGKTYEGQIANGLYHGYGVCHYADGAVYDGQWVEGKRHGQGAYIYADQGEHKRHYEGSWVEDRMEGRGKFTYQDQSTYEGEFVDWKFHGFGKRCYATGNVYEGMWEQDKQCGQGTYTYKDGKSWTGEFKNNGMWTGAGFLYYFTNNKPNGKTYEGTLLNGACHGQGVCHYADGAVYDGQWVEGKRHGFGKFKQRNGQRYEGQWTEDAQTGRGKIIYTTGSVYEGDVQDGMSHGFGRRQYANGCSYEGSWRMDKQCGQGTYTYEDGKSWTGEFQDNKMWNGEGFLYYFTNGKRNGKTYDGQVQEGQPHGQGRYTYADGAFYEGQWEKGQRHGQGIYETASYIDEFGPLLRYQKGGTWVKGKLVEGWETSLRRRKDGSYKPDAWKEGKWDYAGNPLGVMKVTSVFGTSKKVSLPGVAAMMPNWKILYGDLQKAIWQFESDTCTTPDGQGRAVCYDGTIIEGFFLAGKVDSSKSCTVTYTDGAVYVGYLEDGLRNGDGLLTTPRGDRYDGRWSDDVLVVGEVVMSDSTGVYTGHMRNGKYSGQGTLLKSDGTKLSGIWENGKLVKPE